MVRTRGFFSLLILGMFLSAAPAQSTAPAAQRLPILFIAGDSTVHNHDGLVGWGDIISPYFDPGKISVENHAMGGRSSRTFIQEGRWEAIRKELRPGDFVLLQFGHNDSKSTISLDRYTLPGIDDTSTEATTDSKTHQPLTIYTFGHYMRQMTRETLAAGATPIICSPVPRNKWADGKIVRGESHTAEWAAAIAKEFNVPFLDLNSMIAERYERLEAGAVKARYFPRDNTHNNEAGAKVNAACVVLGILSVPDLALKPDLTAAAQAQARVDATISAAATQSTSTP